MSQYLEGQLRHNESIVHGVEALHDWHASISEVEATGELPFSLHDMWTFAVVRNPFDRLVSYCAAFDPDFSADPHSSIHRHLQSMLDGETNRWLLPQEHFAQAVKTIYRFEFLAEAVKDINQRFGIPADSVLPVVNESEHARYPVYFTGELKGMAETFYANDLRTFDYKF